ncbi:MAG: hypothetical protein M5U19_12815 [Microthrixaceae bacterium]|nr:hypothetical protein [Microthrixaceae bacterium]
MTTTTRSQVMLLAAILLSGTVMACSGDDESSPSPDDDAAQTSTSDGSGEGTGTSTSAASDDQGGQAMNDIQECEISGGTGMASGAIENLSEEAASYELTLAFTDDATGDELGRGTAEVDGVEPGGRVSGRSRLTGCPTAR